MSPLIKGLQPWNYNIMSMLRIEAYDYNEETGEIKLKEDYDGINILFNLPIDSSKGDPEKAEEYLKALEAEWTSDSSE